MHRTERVHDSSVSIILSLIVSIIARATLRHEVQPPSVLILLGVPNADIAVQ